MLTKQLTSRSTVMVLLGLLVSFSLTAASAAQIGIAEENNLGSLRAEACMSTTVASTATAGNNLRINNINVNCIGLPLAAHVVTSNGVSEINPTGTVTGVTFTSTEVIPTPANVIGVKVAINGWNVPSTWTYNNVVINPISPDPNTPGIIVTTSGVQNSPTSYCSTVTVSTNSTTPITWQLKLRATGAPFNGDLTEANYVFNPANPYRILAGGAVNGVFTVGGRQPANRTVVAGSPKTFTICNNNIPPAP